MKYSNPKEMFEKLGLENTVAPYSLHLSHLFHPNIDLQNYKVYPNIFVCGGRKDMQKSYVEPNLLKANTNYVVMDPDGYLSEKYADHLMEKGYQVDILDFSGGKSTCQYNPFLHIKDETDIGQLIDMFMHNSSGYAPENEFWNTYEEKLLYALMMYEQEHPMIGDCSFSGICDLLDADLDIIFSELKRIAPESRSCRLYENFKLYSGGRDVDVILSLRGRLTAFLNKNAPAMDEIDFGRFINEKQALFLIVSPKDDAAKGMAAMLYSQLIKECRVILAAHDVPHQRRTHFLIDFSQGIYISDIEIEVGSTALRDGIYYSFLVNDLNKLKQTYPDRWMEILGPCDIKLYLNGKKEKRKKRLLEAMERNCYIGNLAADYLDDLQLNECLVQIKNCHPYKDEKCIMPAR